jgi:NADPH:quinone reductase-like Zn-dependent oxidoreductase
MKAVVGIGGRLEIKDIPVLVPGEGQVLIKVATVAQNPIDRTQFFMVFLSIVLITISVGRSLERWSPEGAIVGVDFAGTVIKFGPGVDEDKDGLKIGNWR